MQTSVAIEPGNSSAFVPVSITAIAGGVSAATTGVTGSNRAVMSITFIIFFIDFQTFLHIYYIGNNSLLHSIFVEYRCYDR